MTFEASDASTAWLNGVLAVESAALDAGAWSIASTGCCETVDGTYVPELERRVLWVWIP